MFELDEKKNRMWVWLFFVFSIISKYHIKNIKCMTSCILRVGISVRKDELNMMKRKRRPRKRSAAKNVRGSGKSGKKPESSNTRL